MTIADYRGTRSNQTRKKKLPLVSEYLALRFRFKETILRFLEIIRHGRRLFVRLRLRVSLVQRLFTRN